LDDLRAFIESNQADQVILTDTTIDHARTIELILLCEQSLVTFTLVPDLLYVMTGRVDIVYHRRNSPDWASAAGRWIISGTG